MYNFFLLRPLGKNMLRHELIKKNKGKNMRVSRVRNIYKRVSYINLYMQIMTDYDDRVS